MEPVRNDTTTDRRTAVELAKRLLVDLIWRTAKIEVDGVTFPDTQEIFDGRAPEGMSVDDIVTVNNIKRAWGFLLGNIDYPVDWQYIREYNRIIGEGRVRDAGRLREYGVRIGGTGWVPEIPTVESPQERVRGILEESEGEDTAMLLFGKGRRNEHTDQHLVCASGDMFPSQAAYEDPAFPEEQLRMLASKTSIKDRFRQVADEANRIRDKHLFTLTPGDVTHPKLAQLDELHIHLVMPKVVKESYDDLIQGETMTFSRFIEEIQGLQADRPQSLTLL